MKKRTVHLIGLIEFTILVSTLLLFILAAPQSLRYIVDRATGATMLTYQKISGNLLRTITVHDLRYEGERLAKEAILDWNFRALLRGALKIDDVELHDVDPSVLKRWLDALAKKYRTHQKKETFSMPSLAISHLSFTTLPYTYEGIKIDRFEIEMRDLYADPEEAHIGSFVVDTLSNHFNITADGSLHRRALHFRHLWIDQIDLAQIIPTIRRFTAHSTHSPKPTSSRPLLENPHIKSVRIDDLKATLLPYRIHKQYRLIRGILSAKSVTSDLKRIDAEKLDADAEFNVGSAHLSGPVKQTTFLAKGEAYLNQRYFDHSVTPWIDFKGLNPIKVSLKANPYNLMGHISTNTRHLFPKIKKDFDLTVHRLDSNVRFVYRTLNVTVQSDANLSTSIGGPWRLYNYFHFDPSKQIRYQGVLYAPKWHLSPYLNPLLHQSSVTYRGTLHTLDANLSSPLAHAAFHSDRYARSRLTFATEEISPKTLSLSLPDRLKELKARLEGALEGNLRSPSSLSGRYDLHSNLSDIAGTLSYRHQIQIEANATLPPHHIWSAVDPKIRPKALFPAHIALDYASKKLGVRFDDPLIHARLHYDSAAGNGTLNLATPESNFSIGGDPRHWMTYRFATRSLRTLQRTFAACYRYTPRPLDGALEVRGSIKEGNTIDATMKGRWLLYEYRPNHFAFAEKIQSDLTYRNGTLHLHNYRFSTWLDHDRIFFAHKPSLLKIDAHHLAIDRLWINDQATLRGAYDSDRQKGHLTLKAPRYHYKDREGDFHLSADLSADLERNTTAISGNLTFLDGLVTYTPRKHHYVQDDDIVVVQERQARQRHHSDLSVDVSIATQKPILYKTPQTEAYFDLDLKFWKERRKELELLGIAKVLGGSYSEGNKRFELKHGEILFGGPILNPYLNLSATYKGDPYLITVTITGTLESPIMHFSSSPYLSQSDILSYLLFDSTTQDLFNSKTSSSTTALKLLGNTFAKEIVSTFGIKLDRLVLSTTEEGGLGIEVGKRLSKNVTLIYINDIVSTIKIKYKFSRKLESDITISPESSGIDFLYTIEH